jgi:hypothetical protein
MAKARSGSATSPALRFGASTDLQPSRNGGASSRPSEFSGLLAPESMSGIFSSEIEKRISDPGRLDKVMDDEGHVDPRALVDIVRGIKSEPNTNIRIEYAKAGKTILLRGSDDGLEERLKDALVRSFSSCLDEGDLQLRIEAILAYAVHAARGNDISDYIDKLVKRLDIVFPLESSAVVCAISFYASQGKTQALHALDAIKDSKNEQAVSAIAHVCRMTVGYGPVQKSNDENHDEKIDSAVKRLVGNSSTKSIAAFTELHGYVTEGASNARAVLDLIKDLKTDDPLVAELVAVCQKIIDSDEKNPKPGGG